MLISEEEQQEEQQFKEVQKLLYKKHLEEEDVGFEFKNLDDLIPDFEIEEKEEQKEEKKVEKIDFKAFIPVEHEYFAEYENDIVREMYVDDSELKKPVELKEIQIQTDYQEDDLVVPDNLSSSEVTKMVMQEFVKM